jgi:Trypsin-like peptidase domain
MVIRRCKIYATFIRVDASPLAHVKATCTLRRIPALSAVDPRGQEASGRDSSETNEDGYVEFEVMAPKDMETPNCYYEIVIGGSEYMNTTCFEYASEPRNFAFLTRPAPRQFRPQTTMERALFSVLRLEEETAGSFLPVGTAFVMQNVREGMTEEFIVTNRHVVERHPGLAVVIHKGQRDWPPAGGQFHKHNLPPMLPTIGRFARVTFSGFDTAWQFHPNADIDVAVYPLEPLLSHLDPHGLGPDVYYYPLPASSIPATEFIESMNVAETVHFIGYPAGIYDSYTQLPLLRQGLTATPYFVEYEGKQSFLIDAPVYEGSSGSPVLLNTRGRLNKWGQMNVTDSLVLLGIVAVHKYVMIPSNGRMVREERNLGEVFRASLILDAINNIHSDSE